MHPSIYKKRLNRTQYFYDHASRLLGEIKGPYRPGNVWKLEVYTVTDQFLGAWCDDQLTPVQRGKCSPDQDRILAAMTMGQSNGIDPELVEGTSTCIGYTFKTKKAATEAFESYWADRQS